jgi:cephalosporin hydroxylase
MDKPGKTVRKKRPRRTFTPAVKAEAVRLCRIGDRSIAQVRTMAADYRRVLVCLESNHTHDHVLAELEAYAPLTSPGSYCVVFDTLVEDMPEDAYPDRPWGVGSNPKTAVWQYLKSHPEFTIDREIQDKLLIAVASDGWLRRADA